MELRAARNGFIVGAVVAVLVLLLVAVPSLMPGYPLAILPLLAAGPVAVVSASNRGPRLLLAGFLSGLAAVMLALLAMNIALLFFNARLWALTGPLSYPPVPPLPKPDFVPGLNWAHELLLIATPLFSAVWAWAYGGLFAGEESGLIQTIESRLAEVRASLEHKLVWLLLGLAAFALALGWVGFSAMEDIHLRGHRTQLLMDWLAHGAAIEDSLDRLASAAKEADPAKREAGISENVKTIDDTLNHLTEGPAHAGIALSPEVIGQTAATYRPKLDDVRAAVNVLVAVAKSDSSRTEANRDLGDALVTSHHAVLGFTDAVRVDAQAIIDGADLSHHSSLIGLMALVAVSGLAGLVLGQAAARSIKRPVTAFNTVLEQVRRADFSGRINISNNDELGELAHEMNTVVMELDRLYQVEREGRSMAEALANQERELNAARQFWAHAIVHDLKGPLTVASGYLDLLLYGRYGPLTPGQEEAIQEASESLVRLSQRTRDIVDLFRLEQSSSAAEIRLEQPWSILEAATKASQNPDAPAVQVRGNQSLPAVGCDRRLIQRVLENLISNAYRHAGSTAQVTVEVWSDGDYVQFAVQDNGPGIRLEDRERVFQLFQSGTNGNRGTGLGLTFCKVVVERHDGKITIEEAPGGGARICFTLPAVHNLINALAA